MARADHRIDSNVVEAFRKLIDECAAEFTVDGKWSDTGQLVRKRTFERARLSLLATSPAAEIAWNRADANLKIGQTGVTQDGVEYVVVPKEPTEAMMDAADAAYDEFEKSVDGVWCGAAPTYRAMTTPSALSGGK